MSRVYVNCCTYNQADYIRDALEGFVMQKTNFPFEVHVNDDASTDGTQEIIKEYAEKYPNIIKPHLRTVNTKGKENYMDSWKAVNCEYFANCEGDDYWTDPNKLQLQVDFLDAHPDFSGCFHRHRVVFEDGSNTPDLSNNPVTPFDISVVTLDMLLKNVNFISNASIMYRWRFNRTDDKIEDWWPDKKFDPGDWFMHLSHLQKGNFGCIDREMSVYRVQKKGVWYGSISKSEEEQERFITLRGRDFLNFYNECNKKFKMDVNRQKNDIISKLLSSYLERNDIDELKKLLSSKNETGNTCLSDAEICFNVIKGCRIFLKERKLAEKAVRNLITYYKICSFFHLRRKKEKYLKKITALKNCLG